MNLLYMPCVATPVYVQLQRKTLGFAEMAWGIQILRGNGLWHSKLGKQSLVGL
jgi:hypothetical protein